ncbi:50S ribosomal protein L15 [Candidatus Parcubacteria bacterium]|nr:50S ribosomal protein L15 [Candidatus Parcubacteria bacterium]
MPLSLHNLKPQSGSRRGKKRVGRGLGSTGSYSGRGVKGQRARSGGRSGLKLKGLRPLMLSTPKQRGFQSLKPRAAVVNVGDLAKAFASGAKVNPKAILKKGLVSDVTGGVKILGKGEIGIALMLEGCLVSASAKVKMEKAGGVIVG